ncbi:MAG: sulfotransferase [Clostridia bacterium]
MKSWNGSAMIKPSLFIIGAAKCRTTSLYEYLKQHREVCFPDGDQIRKLRPDLARKNIKEPKCFSSRYHTHPHLGPGDILTVDRKVVRDLKDYLYLFSFAGDRPVVEKASTDTIFHPRTTEDIHAFNPEGRIIILLRDPIRRARSAYMHLAGKKEKLPLEEDALSRWEI